MQLITGVGFGFRGKYWHDTCFGCDGCDTVRGVDCNYSKRFSVLDICNGFHTVSELILDLGMMLGKRSVS